MGLLGKVNWDDQTGFDTDIKLRAKKQAALLQHFWTRWRREYLTGLRKFHQARAPNADTVKPGSVILVHDDTPRINWYLAVVGDTIVGEDGLVRSANIRTSTGKTNRPISKLYPLEVTAEDSLHHDNDSSQTVQPDESNITSDKRPVRKAALRGRQQVIEWIQALCGPPQDVRN